MCQIYLILECPATCFGLYFRPSSGVRDCTYILYLLLLYLLTFVLSRHVLLAEWILSCLFLIILRRSDNLLHKQVSVRGKVCI